MICPKCKTPIVEGAAFCSGCGEKLALQFNQNVNCCPLCGQVIVEGSKFCTKCGTAFGTAVQPNFQSNPKAKSTSTSSDRIDFSYAVSIISALISFLIRYFTQQTYYSLENMVENRRLIGIDSDTKPILTVIPIFAAIIVSLLIVSDKNSTSQRKAIAFIVNFAFIGLAILFIWYDIPASIW